MKTLPLRWRAWLLALVLTWLTAISVDRGTASAQVPAGSPIVTLRAALQCDANRLLHATTHEYRMFYEAHYAAAQRVTAATQEYRWFYDGSYAAAQRIAAATDRYCTGQR